MKEFRFSTTTTTTTSTTITTTVTATSPTATKNNTTKFSPCCSVFGGGGYFLITKFALHCTSILSHPLYLSYFLFFSPYLIKLLCFLSPLFLTTTLLLLPSFLYHQPPTLQLDENPRPGELELFEKLGVYEIVFGDDDDYDPGFEIVPVAVPSGYHGGEYNGGCSDDEDNGSEDFFQEFEEENCESSAFNEGKTNPQDEEENAVYLLQSVSDAGSDSSLSFQSTRSSETTNPATSLEFNRLGGEYSPPPHEITKEGDMIFRRQQVAVSVRSDDDVNVYHGGKLSGLKILCALQEGQEETSVLCEQFTSDNGRTNGEHQQCDIHPTTPHGTKPVKAKNNNNIDFQDDDDSKTASAVQPTTPVSINEDKHHSKSDSRLGSRTRSKRSGQVSPCNNTNNDDQPSSPSLGSSFGSGRRNGREIEWRRTLACKLFEERHHSGFGGSGRGERESEEGMDVLWEAYEKTEEKKKKTTNSVKQSKSGELRKVMAKTKNKLQKGRVASSIEVEGGKGNYGEEECEVELDDDVRSEAGGQVCCLQALRLSAGKMSFGMGRKPPGFSKVFKGLKGMAGIGWSSSSQRGDRSGNRRDGGGGGDGKKERRGE